MGDDDNAARRDAGAREPGWGFETRPNMAAVAGGDLAEIAPGIGTGLRATATER
jgi:hypothetical protein